MSKFLGIRVVLIEDGGHLLDQEEAITDLLREQGIWDANSTLAPIVSGCYEVQPSDGVLVEVKGKYVSLTVKGFQSLVVSLLEAARCTHPGIVFSVHKATRQTHQPLIHDWKSAKRVAR